LARARARRGGVGAVCTQGGRSLAAACVPRSRGLEDLTERRRPVSAGRGMPRAVAAALVWWCTLALGRGSGEGDAAVNLLISTDAAFAFDLEGADADQNSGSQVFRDAAVLPPFSCMAEGGALPVEPEQISIRRLRLMHRAAAAAESAGAGGLLDGLRPFAGPWASADKDEEAGSEERSQLGMRITNARIRATMVEDDDHNLPVLHAALEQPLPEGTTLEVLQEDSSVPAELAILYDCWRSGRAKIQLKFTVVTVSADNATSTQEVCLKWVKVCAVGPSGWGHLKISEGQDPVLQDGVLQEDWSTEMNGEGTHDTVTRFTLSSDGIERLRVPTVTSSSKLLRVDIRGSFYSEASDDTFEVSTDPLVISVLYTCESDGVADVTLELQRAVLSDEHRPDTFLIKWRKRCGAATYKHLDVVLKRDDNRTKTQVVFAGVVLPGFGRPCRPGKLQPFGAAAAGAAGGGQLVPVGTGAGDSAGECETGGAAFQLSVTDMKTTLELRVSREGMGEPPSFQPLPDLAYDRRMLSVKVIQQPRAARDKYGSSASSSQGLNQTMIIRYVCFRDGVSTILLTLHILAHKSIDIAWKKQCLEPKSKVGRALTAPQAVLIVLLSASVLACGACVLFFCCASSRCSPSESSPWSGGGDGRRQKRRGYDEVEMTSNGRGPRPDPIGSEWKDDERQEIVFHGAA